MGIAVGDNLTAVVTPLSVLPYDGARAAARQIAELAKIHRADCIVIGLPTNEDGERTAACARSEALATHLRELDLAVELQPEFLSTNEARRRARAAGLGRGKPVDHFAAQVVLEEFLAVRVNQGKNFV